MSTVEVMENERCELVLSAVFNWEPAEFFQKRCDMITLWFFHQQNQVKLSVHEIPN